MSISSNTVALRTGVGVALAILAGCASIPPDYTAADAPRYDSAIRDRCPRPCVALVLGSGGPRGFAHVGVFKALDAAGIRPGMIVGASVGALIGTLYASGLGGDQLETVACDIDATRFLQITPNGFKGNGIALEQFVNETVGGRTLESFALPIAVTATRVHDEEPDVFTAGNAGVAVRASAAIPGTFPVATIRGIRYIDGDEWTPVPIRIARALGADVVIAVDIAAHPESTPADAPASWVARDVFRAGRVAAEKKDADIVIHPDLGYYTGVSAEYRRRSIAIAEAAATQAMPRIQALLRR